MANEEKKEDDSGIGFWGFIFILFKAVFYAWPIWIISLLFKKSISNALHLQDHARKWDQYSWIYTLVRWICTFILVGSIFTLIRDVIGIQLFVTEADKTNPIFIGGNIYVDLIFTLLRLIPTAFICSIIIWLEQYGSSPEVKKANAGKQAEQKVADLLAENQHRYPSSLALHGNLFVFNAGTKDEFSAEIDHLFITQNNFFVIETKYKSGTIFATENGQEWKVQGKQESTTMRNALSQCKNTCRVLLKQFDFQFTPIPLVVIVGNDVKIVDAPGNVLALETLIPAIDGFESEKRQSILTPEEILKRISMYIDNSADAHKRHIERANLAGYKHRISDIVKTSSVNL